MMKLVDYSDTDESIASGECDVTNNGKKRKRNVAKWKRNVAKNKRLKGLQYKSAVSNKLIKERKIGKPCKCRMKCFEKIPEEIRENIHEEFWKTTKSWDQRRQYISLLIDVNNVKRRRKVVNGNAHQGVREKARNYHLLVNKEKLRVCKVMFVNTLSVSGKFIHISLTKKSNTVSNLIIPDQRGRHIPANKTKPNIIQNVEEHINKFPKYESHYSREKTKRLYLGPELNISKMYKLYLENCEELSIPLNERAKEWLYRDIFKKNFNISFHLPFNDTCDDCDSFLISEKDALKTETEKLEIRGKQSQHQEEAKLRYKIKNEDTRRGKESLLTEEVLTIDMQKCLPVPSLTNSKSFYLRKLWVLNETIHSNVSGKSYAKMWDETKAGRGSNEVGSCILHWAKEHMDRKTEILTIWTDNCTGQNRNIGLVMTYFWILHEFPQLKEINHKFLLKGHTHMEVDSVHSAIERTKRRMDNSQVFIPRDWEHIVRNCKNSKPINVYSMQMAYFLNFELLYKTSNSPFVLRKKNTAGELFQISKVVWLHIKSTHPGTLFYKTSFTERDFKELNLVRIKRKDLVFPNNLEPIRNHLKPINIVKYQNLQKMMEWVPQEFHHFYRSLPHSANVPLDQQDLY